MPTTRLFSLLLYSRRPVPGSWYYARELDSLHKKNVYTHPRGGLDLFVNAQILGKLPSQDMFMDFLKS